MNALEPETGKSNSVSVNDRMHMRTKGSIFNWLDLRWNNGIKAKLTIETMLDCGITSSLVDLCENYWTSSDADERSHTLYNGQWDKSTTGQTIRKWVRLSASQCLMNEFSFKKCVHCTTLSKKFMWKIRVFEHSETVEHSMVYSSFVRIQTHFVGGC